MKTEYQKCMDGEFFEGSDPELAALTLQAKRLLALFNNTDYADKAAKRNLLEQLLGGIGDNVHIDINFHCEYGKNIFLGNNVIINMNCTFVDNNKIEIGNNILIASNVQIYTATHPTMASLRVPQPNYLKNSFCNTYALPIKVEDNVWIGGGAILLPGVVIGANSVIGAGSVVTRSIPANTVAVGNPCRVIKYLEE